VRGTGPTSVVLPGLPRPSRARSGRYPGTLPLPSRSFGQGCYSRSSAGRVASPRTNW
jgi:hypothetical protein